MSGVGAWASILSIAASMSIAACHGSSPATSATSAPTVVPAPPPLELASALSAPRTEPAQQTRSPTISRVADTASEAHVTIDTHGADVDVRQVLSFLADKGRIHLIYSPDVSRKIRLQLTDVPVSEALTAVLSLAGLALESTVASAPTVSQSVVFYQVPVNVDSLSVEAIMKRFGVGPSVAALLARERSNRP